MVHGLVIDDTYGWIVEQTITDENGRLLATIHATDHRFEPISGATLPHQISVELPMADLSFQIDVADYAINQFTGDPGQLWSLPRIEGFDLVNLAETGLQTPTNGLIDGTPSYQVPPAYQYQTPRSGFRPSYRGYSTMR